MRPGRVVNADAGAPLLAELGDAGGGLLAAAFLTLLVVVVGSVQLPAIGGEGIVVPLRAGEELTWRYHAAAGSAVQGMRAPVCGALLALVSDHVVQGSVIYPAAAYLEMTRAASSLLALGDAPRQCDLSRVFFMVQWLPV